MRHENFYCKFYYELCFIPQFKKVFFSNFTKFLTAKKFNISEVNIVSVYPVNTQCHDNILVRSKRRRTSTKRCSNVDATTAKLQR